MKLMAKAAKVVIKINIKKKKNRIIKKMCTKIYTKYYLPFLVVQWKPINCNKCNYTVPTKKSCHRCSVFIRFIIILTIRRKY
jgi:hypothetical protein